jgi:hypothetical protein
MDDRSERLPSPTPKEPEPRTFLMKVPGWAVLYEDPEEGAVSKVGLVRDFFPLEEGEEGERFLLIRCSGSDRRTTGKKPKRIRWDRVTFQVTERRNGDEIEVTKWGYFATRERTKKEAEAGESFQYLGKDGFHRGPKLRAKGPQEPPGLQYEFTISPKPVPVGQKGRLKTG